jgi:hypothetical protein
VSKSDWKGDKSKRFCIDYRLVNAKTLPLQYTMPRIEMLDLGYRPRWPELPVQTSR